MFHQIKVVKHNNCYHDCLFIAARQNWYFLAIELLSLPGRYILSVSKSNQVSKIHGDCYCQQKGKGYHAININIFISLCLDSKEKQKH